MKSAVLGDRATLFITGIDAENFLENLITCKISRLVEGEAAFGALLTPQGKILYDFFLQKHPDGYMLDVAANLATEFLKRLTFYRLRAQVEISEPNMLPVTVCWDCEAPTKNNSLKDPRHPDLGYRIYNGDGFLGETASYQAHRINLGIPEGGQDFEYGDVYPHEALMDQFEGIDFKKGCYVGQEVVSRMQHRGTVKKRIVKVQSTAQLPATGTSVTADGKPAGRLGTVSTNIGLALLRLDRVVRAEQVLVGETPINIKLPDWVSFTMPEPGR